MYPKYPISVRICLQRCKSYMWTGLIISQCVVAMSSSQRVNRGRACFVANRDYSEYYMCVHVVCQITFLCSFQGIINN